MELERTVNAIIFDLDGTLVDTVPDVRLALNAMLRHYGLRAIAPEKIYALIGNGAKTMITQAFAENDASIDGNEMNNALTLYLNYYKAKPVVETKVYPGVTDVLELFQQKGIKLAICTNKPAVMTKIVLDALNMSGYFSAIIAGDELEKPKPHADHIHAVIKKIGLMNTRAVMVGDSEVDMACANHAGIPFIGVSYGYHLGQLNAENLIHHFVDLPHAIRNLTYA